MEHFVDIVGNEKLAQFAKHDRPSTAVGPITANALHQAGVDIMIVADDTTADAVIAALENHFAERSRKASAAGAVQE